MKKYFFFATAFASFSLFVACGGGNSEKTTESKDSSSSTAKASSGETPAYKKLLDAISTSNSDCLTCHKLSEASTGPSYQDVANKYENTDANVTMLADKIIKGGSGNWGSVPMTPHPALSEDNAKQIVKYILALKK